MTLVEEAYPGSVVLRDVGLRDGLQMVETFPSTTAKRSWIANDYRAGLRHFDVGSYVPAKAFPQFADVDLLVESVASLAGAHSSVLAVNLRGAQAALDGRANEIICVVSASEDHNRRNARRSREEGLAEIAEISRLRDAAGHRPLLSVGLAMAFGCSIAGEVAISEVARMAEHCVSMGIDVVGIADTVGYAGPNQVRAMIRALRSSIGDVPLALHFHDTRGMGIANVATALDEGVRIFDASLGGLGGCPFAPAATGNVVLEDVAFLCQTMGFALDIDIAALIEGRRILADAMPSEVLHGAIAKAGLPKLRTI